WNFWSTPEQYGPKNEIFTAALEKAGRDPKSLWRTTQALTFQSADGAEKAASMQRPAIGGTPQQLVDAMGAYAAAGVDEFILPLTNLREVSQINDLGDRFLTEVAAHIA